MTGRGADERGSILWLGMPSVAFVALALLLTVDLAAYLVAAERARGAADAAALAAVAAADPRGGAVGSPRAVAARVARGMGAQLHDCACRPGRGEVEVAVTVEVRAVAVTRFAGREVEATSRARLVPDDAIPITDVP